MALTPTEQALVNWLSGILSAFNVENEDLSDECDGIKTDFELANYFIAESTCVYINGHRVDANGIDYDEVPASKTITFIEPPPADIRLIVDYRYT
jgi:hypothetical protein